MRLSNWLRYRRFPMVRVAEARDQGAAVFASIARYYGHQITLEQARSLVDTDRDGTTLAGLRDGGRAIGLNAMPAHASYDSLAHVHLPSILHLNGQAGHYVILCAWTPDAVVIVDPHRGLRELRREDLIPSWSGFLVEFQPTPARQSRELAIRPLRLALRLVRSHLGLLAP